MAGTLFVVATPIGNLEDISARAVRVLREASVRMSCTMWTALPAGDWYLISHW